MNNIINLGKKYIKESKLYDEWEAQHHHFDIEDVFLVSFPKSGNTWIRFILTGLYLWELNKGLSEPNYFNIHTYVKDLHLEKIRERRYFSGLPRIIKSHRPYTKNYNRVIFVVRDVRDVMLSFFNYINRNEKIFDSFEEFIKDPSYGVKAWTLHTNSWLQSKTNKNKKLLFLSYEDLIDDSTAGLKKIIDFINVNFPAEALEWILKQSSKEKIKSLETKYGRARTSNVPFLRKAEKQQWKQEMAPQHLEYILNIAANTLKECGYEI